MKTLILAACAAVLLASCQGSVLRYAADKENEDKRIAECFEANAWPWNTGFLAGKC